MARDIIVRKARKYGIDPKAALAVAAGEGGINYRPGAIGDRAGGGSYGPFQLYAQGALPARFRGNPEEADRWAWSPEGIDYALRKMKEVGASGLTGNAAIETIIRKFERPADPDTSVRNAIARYGGIKVGPVGKGARPSTGVQRAASLEHDSREGVRQALLDFALDWANTGRISTNVSARLLNAVSSRGTVEPPSPKDARSKHRNPVQAGVVDNVLAAAHTQVGKPYQFGSGPSTESFDCSDLVQWAWKQVGVDIPRTTYEQMRVLPQKSWGDLKPGDLIYKNDGGHVVMYVGGGKVIAAPYTGTVVQYQPLSRFKSGNYHVRSVM